MIQNGNIPPSRRNITQSSIIHLTNKILLYYHLLFLLQIVNHLLAVLAECVIADVYPV